MSGVAATVDVSRALTIGGWMSESELLWLATQACHCNVIVEFGSLHGRSTRALGDHCPGKVYAVDPWGGDYLTEDGAKVSNIDTDVYPYFCQNLADLIKIKRVIPVRQYSYRFKCPEPVDMVFIDGDHRYETVVADIAWALDNTKSGALICGHDYGHPQWPGVKQAVDEIFANKAKIAKESIIWWTLKS